MTLTIRPWCFNNQRLEDFLATGLEGGQGAGLVRLHHSAVADYVSRENGGETAMRRLFWHTERPPMLLRNVL
jgi:hypothetical protein